MLKNTASQSITALLLDTNGEAVTDETTTVYVTGEAGTQTAGTGTVTHEGNGQWSYIPTQDETNYDSIAFLFTNPSAISVNLQVFTEATAVVPGSLGVVVPGAVTVTGYQIIENALKKINVVGAEQTISSPQLEHGRQQLNMLLSQWKIRSLYAYAVECNSWAWTNSKQSYSIGPTGADFTLARPVRIDRANVIRTSVTPNARVPLAVIEINEYADIDYPTESDTEPTHLYYKPSIPNGTLYPWPYPKDTAAVLANKLELFTWSIIETVSDVAIEFALPDGYEMALTLSLAEFLAIDYEKSISTDLLRFARQARMAITSVNSRAPKISTRDYGVPTAEAY